MININATLLAQIVQFLLFMFLLNRLMLRPIRRKIDERWRNMEDAKKSVDGLAQKAEDLSRKREAVERDARKAAAGERMQLKQEALSQAEGLFEETRNKVALIREQIEKDVQAQIEKAQAILNQEVTPLADEIVGKITGRRVSS